MNQMLVITTVQSGMFVYMSLWYSKSPANSFDCDTDACCMRDTFTFTVPDGIIIEVQPHCYMLI